MQKIIGRVEEKTELKRLYESGKPEFVVVYCRRRVGKTFLIREFFEGQFAFYHTGLSQQEMDIEHQKDSQLQNFASSLRRYGKTGQGTPKDWQTAFDCLQTLLEKYLRHRKLISVELKGCFMKISANELRIGELIEYKGKLWTACKL